MKHLKRHWPALVLAFFALVVVIAQPLVGVMASGKGYQGVWISTNGDWLYYVARIRDISLGRTGGNPYIAEHAMDAYPNIPGPETVLSWIVRLTGIDPVHLEIVMEIVMPIICTLLLYALLYRISRSRTFAFWVPLALIGLNIWHLGRPIRPQINLSFTFTFLMVWVGLLEALDRRDAAAPLVAFFKREWKRIVACGALLGFLYFIYFYDWSFLWVALACAGLVTLAMRRRDVGLLNAAIGVISLPFFAAYYLIEHGVFAMPFYDELAPRIGVIASRLPETLPRTLVAIVACALFVVCIRSLGLLKSRVAQGMIGLLLANIAYPNTQILTGTIFQFASHWALMPILIFTITSAYLYPHLVTHPPSALSSRRMAWLTGGAFFAVFLIASVRLSAYLPPPVTAAATDRFVYAQRFGPVMNYLNTATPQGSVVLAHATLSQYIPSFTHNHIYYHWYIFSLTGSDREIMERYLLSHAFDPSFYEQQDLGVNDHERPLWNVPSGMDDTTHAVHRALNIPYANRWTLEREQAYARTVLSTLRPNGGAPALVDLKKFRLDYIVWDTKEQGSAPSALASVERVFEQGDFVIYRIR